MTTTTRPIDAVRRLAVRRAIITCALYGWLPDTDTAARLVTLQEAIIRGRYREGVPEPADRHLEFARYLAETGRISE